MWQLILFLFSGFVRYSAESSGHKPGYVLTANSTRGQLEHFCAVVSGFFGTPQPVSWIPLVSGLDAVSPEILSPHSPGSLGIAVPLQLEQVHTAMRILDHALFILPSGGPANLAHIPRSSFSGKILFAELKPVDFDRLILLPSNSSMMDAMVTLGEDPSLPYTSVFNPAIVFVHLCAFGSILLGCGMVLLSWDSLLSQLRAREASLKGSKLCVFVSVALFMAFCCACLLLYYFFYDVAVYIAITVYFVLGTLAIAHVLSFWVMQFCICARKTVTINYQLWRWSMHRDVLLVKLCFLPIGLAVMSAWVYYRNDFRIGWPMQSVIGIIFVAWILSLNMPCPSLKLISLVFTLFVLYDVFFVFITPYFASHQSRATQPSHFEEANSLRVRRSVEIKEGYMEAIATGSAGRSGESLPASFRFRVDLSSGVFGCSTHEYGMLLGYGDAVFPGFLSAYLALFDSVWRVRFRRNFLASLFGYILGTLATHLAMSLMQRGQPALLYLCPFTLLSTVLACLTFGGIDELKRLWTGRLVSPQSTVTVDFRGDHAVSSASDDIFLSAVASPNLDDTTSQTALKPVA